MSLTKSRVGAVGAVGGGVDVGVVGGGVGGFCSGGVFYVVGVGVSVAVVVAYAGMTILSRGNAYIDRVLLSHFYGVDDENEFGVIDDNEEIRTQCVETALRLLATASNHTRDGVRKFKTASECSRLKRSPRRIIKATAAEDLRRRCENPKKAFVDYTSSHADEMEGKQFTTNQGPRNFNESTSAWKDKPDFNWDNDHNEPVSTKEEVIEETEELGEETEGETKEEEEDDLEYFDTFPAVEELRYHKWLLNNPRPPGSTPRVTNQCDVQAQLLFDRNFTYECDFVMLEDTSSVIDPYLGVMVLGKPFTKETRLICNKYEGTITFETDKGKITFKMPHKMEGFKRIDKDILKTDNILPFLITGDDSDQAKTHYLNSLNLGPTYRHDESMP
uniref:Uncharacterized protein n=1 Tax=Tanacetum cinerariifolium TaxID=118510 RepID=A0A699GVP4_TANCI|nr:hypothetical protein [Tanacetum cinerariifolium]